jgi:hypothetical protein
LVEENKQRQKQKKDTHAALTRAAGWEDRKRVVVRGSPAQSADGSASVTPATYLITCSQSFSLCQITDAKWEGILQQFTANQGAARVAPDELAQQIYKAVMAARRKAAPLVTVEQVAGKENASKTSKRGRKKAPLPSATNNPALAQLACEYHQLCGAYTAVARDLKVRRNAAKTLETAAVAEMRKKKKVEKNATSSLLGGKKFKLVLRVRDSRPKLPAKEIQSIVQESVNQFIHNGTVDAALAIAKIRDGLSAKRCAPCKSEDADVNEEEEGDEEEESVLTVEDAPLDKLTIKFVALKEGK